MFVFRASLKRVREHCGLDERTDGELDSFEVGTEKASHLANYAK